MDGFNPYCVFQVSSSVCAQSHENISASSCPRPCTIYLRECTPGLYMPSSSVTWYQTDKNSSLLQWCPHNPYLTLLITGNMSQTELCLYWVRFQLVSLLPFYPPLHKSATSPPKPSGIEPSVTFINFNRTQLNCQNTDTLGKTTTSELSIYQ